MAKAKEEKKEKVSKSKKQGSEYVVFKADSPQNIDGFWFNPFLVVKKDDRIKRGSKEYNTVYFLTRVSAFYGKKFYRVESADEAKVTVKEDLKDIYTKGDLIRLASDHDIRIDSSADYMDIYMAVFGGSLTE